MQMNRIPELVRECLQHELTDVALRNKISLVVWDAACEQTYTEDDVAEFTLEFEKYYKECIDRMGAVLT